MPEPLHARTHSVDTEAEMHELNYEADYLDEKVKPGTTNGADLERHNSDPDAQAMVIESLRTQIQDLCSQVSQLNNKLVNSYDRVSDLEDDLHIATTNLRHSTLKISELELERSQHLSALSTGLLVEKDHVTSELTRLMEKATEEAAQRGQAETMRAEIEKDLDDLSASLFNQANSMVAEARIAQARSERKAEETERALRGAEEVVGILQDQMQTLQSEKERAFVAVEEMRITMGKGKWVERPHEQAHHIQPRLLCSHIPYQEYLAFITHLRNIRPSTQQPPAMSTLLPLPFLARLVTEDSDPTVRLDLAPSLNWLTRRSVISAIHSGQLTVEPMPTMTLLEELAPSTIPGHLPNTQISCALCGTCIIPPAASADSPTSATFAPVNSSTRPAMNGTWSSSLFKTSLVQSIAVSGPNALVQSSIPPIPTEPPSQVYIFRLAATSSGLPVPLQQTGSQYRPTIYPLCTTHWCLARLRTTCSMWAFVRTGVVERIWEETAYVPPMHRSPLSSVTSLHGDATEEKTPAVPPRKTRMGIGALWGTVQRSLSSSREPESESKEATKQDTSKPLPQSPTKKSLLPPPPVHPSLSAPAATTVKPSAVPPPLPKRNRDRETHAPKVISSAETAQAKEETPVVAPSPLSRTTTQDNFTTPEEEPSAFLTQTSAAPADIPLPPSVPPSPAPPLVPELSTAAASADATANADAPLVHSVPPAGPQGENAPTVRGVSPTPPPIPRRAPGRARAGSVAVVRPPPAAPTLAAPAIAEEESTPAAAIGGTNGTLVEEDETEEEPTTVVTPAEEPIISTQFAEEPTIPTQPAEQPAASTQTEETEVPAEPAQPVEELAMSTESTEECSAPAESVEETQPVVETATDPQADIELPSTTAEDEQEPASQPQQLSEFATEHLTGESILEPSEAREEESATVQSETEEQNAAEESASAHEEEVVESRPPSPVAPSTNGVVDGIEGQSPGDIDPADIGGTPMSQDQDYDSITGESSADRFYVGDGTWEERTWKELVRLREEMFWARIGGVRQTSGR
ncbi:hypothetical protein WOLCODRAFT_139866 [Wolfiporia cocos MD-104 SS10]|uniref:GDP/GTP exchange factor Sec2 N-terminal domain-containing protein n=1 Tax=Wolfiporia cocos (strain MD-104) TaxID=742152 RepID=A0A2H3IZI6_WOLCO|nr:hypothetical protein WOLCODRAFT_139866 [Wolfiporia cocos MD-104 SS10]